MKSPEQKTILSAAILTGGFAVVLLVATFIGFRDSRTLVIWGSLMMIVAVFLAMRVWGRR